MNMINNRAALLINLFLVLASVYLLVFRADIIGTDELFLFDMTESIARRGNLDATLAYSHSPIRPAIEGEFLHYEDSYELLQPILAVLLFLIGDAIPDVNLLHVVWLFNVIVVALIPLVFFWGVRVLGYDDRTAWYSALLLGMGTLLMPYSRTFFREPLMTVFITIAVVLALKIYRVRGRLPIIEGLLLLVAFALAIAAKGIAALFLPVLLLLMIRIKFQYWVVAFGGSAAIAALLVIILEQTGIGGTRLMSSRWLILLHSADWGWIGESFRGYLFNPSRSFFLLSPILLLAPYGMWLLWKRGEWRLVVGMVALFVVFAAGYGLLRANVWHSGIGIGARYLLPLIPLFAFTFPPIIEQIRHATIPVWTRRGFLLMIAVSIGVQVLFSSYSELAYHLALPLQTGDRVSESWDFALSPFVRYAQNLNFDTLDTAWRHSCWWGVLVAGFLLILLIELRGGFNRISWGRMACSGGFLLVWVSAGIFTIRDDPRSVNYRDDMPQLFQQLAAVSRREDAIVLKDDVFFRAFATRYKAANLIVTLPISPGEMYSPTHQAAVNDGTTAELAGAHIVWLYDYLASRYERVWLVSYFGDFHLFARRPEERYLAEHYHRFQEITIGDNLRVIGFHMEPIHHENTTHQTDFIVGDVLHLRGYNLPSGESYRAGDILPVTLHFSVLAPVLQDYTVSLQLVTLEGQIVAQHDSFPIGGFARTSAWDIGESYHDGRGLRLPDDLQVGNYQLQIIVYYWKNGIRLSIDDRIRNITGDRALLQAVTIR